MNLHLTDTYSSSKQIVQLSSAGKTLIYTGALAKIKHNNASYGLIIFEASTGKSYNLVGNKSSVLLNATLGIYALKDVGIASINIELTTYVLISHKAAEEVVTNPNLFNEGSIQLNGVSALEISKDTIVTSAPAGTSTSLMIGHKHSILYVGTGTLSLPGHVIGHYSLGSINAPGKTVPLLIGSEASIENYAGAADMACASVNTLNINSVGQAITEFIGSLNQVTSNAGTITKGSGVSSRLTGNTGTINEWNGFEVTDGSGVSGVTRRRAFLNNDAGAPIVSKSAIIDSSVQVPSTPTNGGVSVILRDISTVLLFPAATIANHTLTFPANAEDGQKISFYTSAAITSLLYTAGPTMLGAPSTIAANGFFTLRYLSSVPAWIRMA